MRLSILQRKSGGFTLGEMMVTTCAFALVGLCAFYTLNTGTVLYAKNTAQNLAHDSSRIAVNRLLHDIHQACSIPQLGHIDTRTPGTYTAPAGSWVPYGTNVTFYADAGAGPTAGVAFQMMGGPQDPFGGPFEIKNDPANPELIQIDSGTGSTPQVGMRLIFPYYNMEDEIVKATSTGQNHYNIWTKNALEVRFKKKNMTGTNIVYYTTRWAYVVEGAALHLYSSAPPPSGFSWPVTVARNIASGTPFSQATSQYIGINLTTQDPHYSNRNYKAINTLLAGTVPYRAQLCVSQ